MTSYFRLVTSQNSDVMTSGLGLWRRHSSPRTGFWRHRNPWVKMKEGGMFSPAESHWNPIFFKNEQKHLSWLEEHQKIPSTRCRLRSSSTSLWAFVPCVSRDLQWTQWRTLDAWRLASCLWSGLFWDVVIQAPIAPNKPLESFVSIHETFFWSCPLQTSATCFIQKTNTK